MAPRCDICGGHFESLNDYVIIGDRGDRRIVPIAKYIETTPNEPIAYYVCSTCKPRCQWLMEDV
jgi:hypothetical protein